MRPDCGGFAPPVSKLPTGEIRAVEGTPFDLRKQVLIGTRLKEVPGPGFDHNYCLSLAKDPWTERHAARFAADYIFLPTY